MINGVVTKKIQNEKQNRDSEFSLGPVKFEASMEHPSEKAHGVIDPVVFGAQIRGLLRNIDLRSISYEKGGGEGRLGWCQSPE